MPNIIKADCTNVKGLIYTIAQNLFDLRISLKGKLRYAYNFY